MASKVEIINRALTHLGERRVTAPSGNSHMDALWQTTLEGVLRSAHWRCATKRAKLPKLSTPPDFGYSYQYQMPSDLLRLIQVGERPISAATVNVQVAAQSHLSRPSGAYQIEGGVILTDHAAPLPIRYVYRVEDMSLLDALFVEALALKLALDAAVSVGSLSDADIQRLARLYRTQVNLAKRSGAVESPDWRPAPGPLRRVRN